MGKIFESTKKFDSKLAGELYCEGKNDKEIAEICGVKPETVRKWRERCGLLSNYEPKKAAYLTQLEKDCIAAKAAGLSYGRYKAQQPQPEIPRRKKRHGK